MNSPADPAPTVATMMTDIEEAAEIRAKYTHSRILVIGRANAGKISLLKRVCNTKEDPVYNKVMLLSSINTLTITSPTD